MRLIEYSFSVPVQHVMFVNYLGIQLLDKFLHLQTWAYTFLNEIYTASSRLFFLRADYF